MIRALNIALRTVHIGAMGILLGGHAFDVDPGRLLPALWITVGTGAVLGALESGGRVSWLHEIRGVVTLVKVALLLSVLLAWDHRLPILLTVVVLGSVGSHMPKRFRHYSLLRRRVINDRPPKDRGADER
jgi:hypothetical protein